MANEKSGLTGDVQNDELYTKFSDVEQEMAAYIEYNPDVFGIKLFSCLATILRKAVLQSFLQEILKNSV